MVGSWEITKLDSRFQRDGMRMFRLRMDGCVKLKEVWFGRESMGSWGYKLNMKLTRGVVMKIQHLGRVGWFEVHRPNSEDVSKIMEFWFEIEVLCS